MYRFAVAALAAWFAGTVRAQDDYQPKPLPAGPEAFTEAKLQVDRAAFWSGKLLAECRAQAGFAEAWRTDLETVFAGFARLWNEQVAQEDDIARLRSGQARLRELGCDEPLVGWAAAYLDLGEGRNEAAAAWLRDEAPALRERLKGAALRYLLEETCWEIAGQVKQNAAGIAQACAARLRDLLTSDDFGPGTERYLLWALTRTYGSDPECLPQIEALEKAVAKPNYALLVWRAHIENGLAWAARGRGTASSIGGQERERFVTHVKAALAAATQANEICPNHPEACEAMIQNLGVLGGGKELRPWFDRAVAAQFDYWPVYGAFAHYLQPRWGGTARDLQAFGEECLATGRFDTQVPLMYVMATQYLTLDARDPLVVWKRSSVQERLEELAKGYTAAATTERQRAAAATHHIVRLALAGQGEAAAAEYERQERPIESATIDLYALSREWLFKILRPNMRNYVPAPIPSRDVYAGYATAAYPGVAKAQPFSAHEHAATSVQVKARTAAWQVRSCLAAYERFGSHDEHWDADARALLAHMPEILGDTADEPVRALAQKLLDAECKDPLVLFAATQARPRDPASRRLRRMIEADRGLDASYTPAFQWLCKRRLWFTARDAGRPDLADAILPGMRDRIARATADPIFAGEDRREFVRFQNGSQNWVFPGSAWVTDDVIAAMADVEGADPWLVHVATGLHLARLADYVTTADQDRVQQAKLAKQHLEQAHALHPELPEAAVGMIVVAAILHEDGATTPREWLDRALAAEIDCQSALHAFVETLLPVYGGGPKVMYRFAEECLASGRFDSELPLWYVRTLQRIAARSMEARTIWAATGVAENLERLFAGYKANGDLGHPPEYLQSLRCLMAWAGGRYAEAAAARQTAGDELEPAWLEICKLEDYDLVEIDLQAAARSAK